MISNRSGGLVIDTIVYLALAKWEPRLISSGAISNFWSRKLAAWQCALRRRVAALAHQRLCQRSAGVLWSKECLPAVCLARRIWRCKLYVGRKNYRRYHAARAAPEIWPVIQSGKSEFVNGSRPVCPMEDEAMRSLVANKAFSHVFTWAFSQRLTDSPCGTKVLRRSDYERLKANRVYFGDFDSFGDFDLIFSASKAENCRGAEPICEPDLRRDPDFPVSLRLLGSFRIKAM